LVGAADGIDDQAVEDAGKVAFVKQSLAGTVERILKESTMLATAMEVPPQDLKPHAMIS
jgi:hypothetical protein